MRRLALLVLLLSDAADGEGGLWRKPERTFAMVKPDAVHQVDAIIDTLSANGLKCVARRERVLSPSEAKLFYREHRRRAFFPNLVRFMTSGPVVVLVLEGDDAVKRWRELIGPTDSQAARRTSKRSIRAKFGTDKQRNAVHGSDSAKSARRELDFFFGARRLVPVHCRLLLDDLLGIISRR